MTILLLDYVATLRQGSMSISEQRLRVLTRPRVRAYPPVTPPTIIVRLVWLQTSRTVCSGGSALVGPR